MENKQLDPQQSLALIQQMIQRTRQRVEGGDGIPFLVMGYLTAAVSLAVWYAFSQTHNANWHFMWFVIPVVGFTLFYTEHRKGRRKEVHTYIDSLIGYIWITIGLGGFLQSMVALFVQIPILYIIVLLMGLGTALTGLVVRSKVIAAVGFVSALLLSPLLLLTNGVDQYLVFAAVFVVMMVIPGHLIRYQSKHPEK